MCDAMGTLALLVFPPQTHPRYSLLGFRVQDKSSPQPPLMGEMRFQPAGSCRGQISVWARFRRVGSRRRRKTACRGTSARCPQMVGWDSARSVSRNVCGAGRQETVSARGVPPQAEGFVASAQLWGFPRIAKPGSLGASLAAWELRLRPSVGAWERAREPAQLLELLAAKFQVLLDSGAPP